MTPPRRYLPNRRVSEAFDFECMGVAYRANTSRFEDGTLGEMFLEAGKIGTAAHIIAKESAVVLSIALQYGVPIDRIYDALPKLSDCFPAGPIGVALKIASERT